MFPALWISKTGLEAQQNRLGVISNNLANVSTTGFKRDRSVFNDLVYQNIRQAGGLTSQDTQLPSGLMLGTGVRLVATEKLHTQGNLTQTGNELDFAIQGPGFFQVLLPDGRIAYSRDGSMQRDGDGRLVTAAGYPMEPAITIDENAQGITIGADGTVSVVNAGETAPTEVGRIELAEFVNPAGLTPLGDNLYQETGASGQPRLGLPGLEGRGTLIQGSLESSNVNVVEELVNMIEAQRAYEVNSRAISTVDEMLQYVSQAI